MGIDSGVLQQDFVCCASFGVGCEQRVNVLGLIALWGKGIATRTVHSRSPLLVSLLLFASPIVIVELTIALGSGISLFVAYNNRLGLNVTVTLDDDFTTINWFILDTDTTNSASYTSYNATLYNMQNLDYGDHHVTVELQDYEGNESTIMFDYAAVTGTRPESKAALAAQTR